MRATGAFRVYFNRAAEYPRVWCVAQGEWELCVTDIVLDNVTVVSNSEKRPPDPDRLGKPSAWFTVAGNLEVLEGGVAVIRGDK
jgi:hypothetical protein